MSGGFCVYVGYACKLTIPVSFDVMNSPGPVLYPASKVLYESRGHVSYMTSFFEYLTKDGGVLSTAVILLGVLVIIASSIVFSTMNNVILVLVGIFAGVLIIVIGAKYGQYKKEMK